MTNVERYVRPTDLEEAWALIREGKGTARPVGGGVDAALYVPPRVTTLVDLSDLPLRYIEEDAGALRIGAGVTLSELLERDAVACYLDCIIAEVLRHVASPLLRNVATVGGTIASAHPWSDVIPLFLVLGAEVKLYDGSEHAVPIEEFVAKRGLAAGALITEVRLSSPAAGAAVAFEKFTRTGFDVALLNCAVYLRNEGGVCRDVRVAAGGTPDTAKRIPAIEQVIEGRPLDGETIEAAAAVAEEAIPVRDDRRASAGYRRILTSAGVRRCLRRIEARQGGSA